MLKRSILFLTIVAALAAPSRAAVLTDPSLIPDGEYRVFVEKVADTKHLVVKLENGLEARIAAASTVSFTGTGTGPAHIFVYKGVIITYRPG